MGRELQKRKRRSSRPTIRQPTSHKSKRLLNPLGNNIIAQNWDKNETTSQNYRRLGLVSRLQAPTGGVEPRQQNAALQARKPPAVADPFAILPTSVASVVSEVRVDRDADGKITRVYGPGSGPGGRENPLNDALNALDTDSEADDDDDDGIADDGETWGGIEDTTTEVFKELEAEANRPREKKVRGLSTREREWLESLVQKHGHDTRAMSRDSKLNPMQQTEADISRRIRKMKGEI